MSATVDETSAGGVVVPSSGARRARRLLTGYFAGQGVMMATWATRLPAVNKAISMLLASGRLAERPRGTGLLLVGVVLVLGTALVVLGQVRSFGALVAVVFGAPKLPRRLRSRTRQHGAGARPGCWE